MALFPRNKIPYTHRGPPLTPISRQRGFELPEDFRKQTPWTVASWWLHCLNEMKKTTHLTLFMQLRPAKKLLVSYEFESVMLGIRKAVGFGRCCPSLWWVLDNAKKLGLEEK